MLRGFGNAIRPFENDTSVENRFKSERPFGNGTSSLWERFFVPLGTELRPFGNGCG